MKVISARALITATALLASFAVQEQAPDFGRFAPEIPSRATCCAALSNGAQACFAPGTPQSYVDELRLPGMLIPPGAAGYSIGARWSNTATDGAVSGTQPVTLTYSFVPDFNTGDPETSNTIHATLDAQFGNRNTWKQVFRDALNSWTQYTGVRYVEVADDGAPWPNTPGALNQRGDVRIVAFDIDGLDGILAYNNFPNNGDMAIDSAENWAAAFNNFVEMRNTVAHEAGHGIGLEHSIPNDSTKLMEPFASDGYDGPQDDDIRGANRHYGDGFEMNDTPQTAADLGVFTNGREITRLSLHTSGDVDWYRLAVSAGQTVRVQAVPIGGSYLVGPQFGAPSSINSTTVQGLTVAVFNEGGTQTLGQGSGSPGGAPTTPALEVPAGQSAVLVKVSGNGGANDVQRYNLRLSTGGSAATQTLTVQTDGGTNPTITASPADNLGRTTIVGSGELIFEEGMSVTLTAVEESGSDTFIRWVLDGDDQSPGQRQIEVVMDEAHTVLANYGATLDVNAGADVSVADGERTRLQASAAGGAAPYAFAWSPDTGLSATNVANPFAEPEETTTYTVVATDANGLQGADSVEVTVVGRLRVDLGEDFFVPEDEAFDISADVDGGSPPYTYAWSGDADFSATNAARPRVELAKSTRLTLRVTDSAARTASGSVLVKIAPPLNVSIDGPEGVLAGNAARLDAVVIGGAAPFDFEWFPAASDVRHEAELRVTPNITTRYTLTVTDAAGQSATANKRVAVALKLKVRIESSATQVSAGETVNLSALIEGGVGPFEYEWSSASDELGTGSAIRVAPEEGTTYRVKIQDSSGQSASAELTIGVSDSSTANPVTMSAPMCNGIGVLGCLPFMLAARWAYRNRQRRQS